MRLDYYRETVQNIKDLINIIRSHPSEIIYQRDKEQNPESIQLEINTNAPPSTIFQPEKKKDICTFCSRRISYKKDQFHSRFPDIPLMIVIQNAFLGDQDQYFHNPNVNHEFTGLIQNATGEKPDTFLIREALRCHFAKEEIHKNEWINNCQTHLKKDVELFKIKGIIIMGNAAPIFIPDAEKLKKIAFQTIELFGIPALISHGPERIVAMKKKRYSFEMIQNSENHIIQSIKNFYNTIIN